MSTDADHAASDQGLTDRDHTAADRDRTADAHDRTADARDARSDARDLRAEARETGRQRIDVAALSDRAGARRDRRGSAADRRHAMDDRVAASADRVHSAQEISDLLLDGLTGSHRRESGLMELQREVTQAHRTRTFFVLAFVDVDNLKASNDRHGHAAGDRLLRVVVDGIRRVVREYDVITRVGGDEFACGLADIPLAEARRRFELAQADLVTAHGASFSVGVVELRPGESLDDLLARADAAMYASRAGSAAG